MGRSALASWHGSPAKDVSWTMIWCGHPGSIYGLPLAMYPVFLLNPPNCLMSRGNSFEALAKKAKGGNPNKISKREPNIKLKTSR